MEANRGRAANEAVAIGDLLYVVRVLCLFYFRSFRNLYSGTRALWTGTSGDVTMAPVTNI